MLLKDSGNVTSRQLTELTYPDFLTFRMSSDFGLFVRQLVYTNFAGLKVLRVSTLAKHHIPREDNVLCTNVTAY